MIVGRCNICWSQPGRFSSGIDVSATVNAGCSLIESNNKKRMLPVGAGGYQRHKGLQKSVALSSRAIVHIVGHVWDDKGKVDSRIEVCERLNVTALGRIEANAFKSDNWIMFSDVLPGNTWTINTAVERSDVRAIAGIVLSIDTP